MPCRNDCNGCKAGTSNDNHEPGKCCLRCRNFEAADKLARLYSREEILEKMKQPEEQIYVEQFGKDIAGTEYKQLRYVADLSSGSLQTNLDRYRALFTWIANNIKWEENDKERVDPLEILTTGQCACLGFSCLYAALVYFHPVNANMTTSRDRPMHCGLIGGTAKDLKFTDYYSHSKTAPKENTSVDHAWNEIFVKPFQQEEGWFKIIDVTWGSDGQIGDNSDTNFDFFTMSNEEFIQDHWPSTPDQYSKSRGKLLAEFYPAMDGASLPKHSHLQQINGKKARADYVQWSSAKPPPFLLNTDIIDVIHRETIIPRAYTFQPQLVAVDCAPLGRSWNKPQDFDAEVYGVDPALFKGDVDSYDVPVASFAVSMSCHHLKHEIRFYFVAEFEGGRKVKIYLRSNGETRLICTESLWKKDDSIPLFCMVNNSEVAVTYWNVGEPLAKSSNADGIDFDSLVDDVFGQTTRESDEEIRSAVEEIKELK